MFKIDETYRFERREKTETAYILRECSVQGDLYKVLPVYGIKSLKGKRHILFNKPQSASVKGRCDNIIGLNGNDIIIFLFQSKENPLRFYGNTKGTYKGSIDSQEEYNFDDSVIVEITQDGTGLTIYLFKNRGSAFRNIFMDYENHRVKRDVLESLPLTE